MKIRTLVKVCFGGIRLAKICPCSEYISKPNQELSQTQYFHLIIHNIVVGTQHCSRYTTL